MNTKIIADNFGVYSAAPLPAMAVNTDSSNYEQSAESTLKSKLENDSTHNTSNKKSVGTKPSHNKTTKPLANSELAAANKKVEELQLQLNLFRNKAYQEQDRADSLQSILDHDGKKEFRAENKTLIAKNKVLERQNDSLVTLMTIYDDLRATMISSEGSEISLLLTEKLRVAKTKQDELEKRNKELELQNKKLNLHIKNLESKVKITPSATKKKK
ncbi:MAG: hypothetical protein NTW54_04510 [Bacteroidetes bacterium]|nr:hypothetical protein [Bacteroidota bacterium]